MNQPIKGDQQMTTAKATPPVEPKKISEIKDLNPFKNKVMFLLMLVLMHFMPLACSYWFLLFLLQKTEFLVTVTIKKIDDSWWYNSCEKCVRTAKPYGELYKCTEPNKCGHIGKPVQRSDDIHCL